MADELTLVIRKASREVWPEVLRALEQTSRSIAELAGIAQDSYEQMETYIASGGNAPKKRRGVCDVTIWTLARLGWLRTGGERDIIQACLALENLPEDAPDEEFIKIESKLVEALHKLPEYVKE